MSFILYNIWGIFQIFINQTLREYLDRVCTIYLNDILVYSDNKEEYIEYIRAVLGKLKAAELYLDIKKYEFKIKSVKYLGLIIINEEIKMNSAKIEIMQR
jgi:hypothetical protein